VLDGEIAVPDNRGVTNIGHLHDAIAGRCADRLVYFAFDLLHLDARDLRRRPIEERKALLVRRSMMSAVRAWSISTTSSAAALIYSSICAGSVPKLLLLRAAKPWAG
jgi:ATP-dependent DNA ligase